MYVSQLIIIIDHWTIKIVTQPVALFSDHFHCFSPLKALLHTRNVSAEEAAMYYFNKLENEVPISQPQSPQVHLGTLDLREFVPIQISVSLFVCSDPQEEGDDDLMFKMVFVVNMDLAMGIGKASPMVPVANVCCVQIDNPF